MAYQVYATVTGTKQGVFKGGSSQRGHEGKIHVTAVSYGVTVPHDAASWHLAGKLLEQPLTFSMLWEECSPQFFAAAYTNEMLSAVQLDYFVQDNTGIEKLSHTLKLTNAVVVDIKEAYASIAADGVTVDGKDVQTVSLTFQKIEIASTLGGASAEDDLTKRV